MIELLHPRSPFAPPPGAFWRTIVPIGSVAVASLAPVLPIVADAPLMPAFGFMMLLAWRLLRPDLWPLWIGLPLGLFDDLFSGQPLGSGAATWALAMLVIDQAEQRMPFRDKWQDWSLAAGLLIGQALLGEAFARLLGPTPSAVVLIPQLAAAILSFPLVLRLAAWLDRKRLAR